MRLSQVDDIGGCRVIGTLDQVIAVERSIRAEFEVAHANDYRSSPRDTRYRAVHVVVVQDGRRVEVQLRTPAEQAWAAWVEDHGSDAGVAVRRYEQLEAEHRAAPDLEIVLLGSASLDQVRITHPHYFNKERGSDSLTQLEESLSDDV